MINHFAQSKPGRVLLHALCWLCHPANLLAEPENQFSLTRAALSTRGGAKSDFLSIRLALLAAFFLMLAGQPTAHAAGNLVITNTSLPNGIVGTAYRVQLGATGGPPPYVWSLATNSNTLPFGLSLNTNGLISGTPTTVQTNSFIVQVTNLSSMFTNKPFTIKIKARPIIPPPIYTNGIITITFTNVCGQTITIQYSTDLTHWFNILTTNLPCGIVAVTFPSPIDPTQLTHGTLLSFRTVDFCEGFAAYPNSLNFQDPADGTTVQSQTLTIANIGSGCILNCAITSTVPWLTISSPQALISAGDSMVLTVGISDATLYAGATYDGAIIVTDTNTPANSQSIPVTLTIAGARFQHLALSGLVDSSSECRSGPVVSVDLTGPNPAVSSASGGGCYDPGTYGEASVSFSSSSNRFSATLSAASQGPIGPPSPASANARIQISFGVGHLTQYKITGSSIFNGLYYFGKTYSYPEQVSSVDGDGNGQFQLTIQLISGPGP